MTYRVYIRHRLVATEASLPQAQGIARAHRTLRPHSDIHIIDNNGREHPLDAVPRLRCPVHRDTGKDTSEYNCNTNEHNKRIPKEK